MFLIFTKLTLTLNESIRASTLNVMQKPNVMQKKGACKSFLRQWLRNVLAATMIFRGRGNRSERRERPIVAVISHIYETVHKRRPFVKLRVHTRMATMCVCVCVLNITYIC